jgi:hypothetical protein
VSDHEATIWVETDAPCTIEVRAGDATGIERTFCVAGHHYAVAIVTGLPTATSVPYEVLVDGERVWPAPDSAHPQSRIRTVHPDGPVRLLFGSCRETPSLGPGRRRGLDPDVLDAYATRMASQSHEAWPDALLLVGDQVYADVTSPAVQKFIRARRDVSRPPHLEVADFEEFTRLYQDSWGEPKTRWLLSTLPSSMIFDDHDVRDDWNTSHAWRLEMQATSWWEERITGALMSYWIYQHLGNLSPAGLAADETYRRVRSVADGEAVLRAFVQEADREADGAKGAQWSYRRDLGHVRMLVIDSRCGRILANGRREMVGEREFQWIESQVDDGEFDHLVVGTSLPWLLPRALHDLESWDEAVSAGRGGRAMAKFGEWLRRAVDLEHWAAFRGSFDRLGRLFARVGRGEHGSRPPATICVVSGDVHHTYASKARYPEPVATPVFQVTCSPIHNTIPTFMRFVFWVGWSKLAERITRDMGRTVGVPDLPIRWHHPTGPHFGNVLALLVFEGRTARLVLERSVRPPKAAARNDKVAAKPGLAIIVDLPLTDGGAT